MTYKDIYTKFLIEYDKADVSSSYPSLTNKEIAVLLDKAMHALIAQKVTGNNPRKVMFDMDSKAMSDLTPIIHTFTTSLIPLDNKSGISNNEILFKFVSKIPDYIIDGIIEYQDESTETVNLVTSIIASKFKETVHNKPWIKTPIMYTDTLLEDTLDIKTLIHVLVDSYRTNIVKTLYVHGISEPESFNGKNNSDDEFPLSDTMCEELINLAIIFACRNVSNPRLTSEVQTKSLEA